VSEARQATDDDIRPLAAALARAFDDDPVMIWLFGDTSRKRLARLARFFAHEAHRHQRKGQVLTNDDQEGAAFWDAPGTWRPGFADLLRSLPILAPAVNVRIPRSLRGFKAIETAHPRAPHWYLSVLGTDPPAQGKGVGRTLVQPVLDRCDREGLGAYLESSKEQNIPYYERFGFTVTGEVRLPDGPLVWPMWRDPDAEVLGDGRAERG
jgi:GNAT superfamily N-acetyltransferase